MINALKESEQKIKDFRQQIQYIKGVVHCEKCGAEIGNNVAFCSSCGAKIVTNSCAEHDENLIRCSGCGVMVDRNVKLCTSCGKQLSVIQQEVTPQSDKAEEHIKTANKCLNCGAEMADNTVFCTQCGNKKTIILRRNFRMQKTKLCISVGVFGALLYFSGLFSVYLLSTILAGYVLFNKENLWLKKLPSKPLR